MGVATVNGVELHYEIDGSGPPCLVLHGGLGVDHLAYRRTLGSMADSATMVFYDHRANGRSGGSAADITVEQLADDADGLAEALGLGPVAVLGHSYGGFVAQELALRHPDRVRKLVLVATTPGQLGDGEEDEQGPPPPAEVQEAFARLPSDDAELAAGFPDRLPHYLHRADPAEVAPLLEGTIFRADALIQGFVALASWSSVDRLASITAPTLVVVGHHDVLTSPAQSRRIASRIPDATLRELRDSGHFCWFDQPDAFFAIVEGFLAD